MSSNDKPIIVHTHEGVICDGIEFSFGEGGHSTFPNNRAGWSAINVHARLYGGFVRHHKWDGTYEEVRWLDSAPYKHRQKWLDANFETVLCKIESGRIEIENPFDLED